MIKYEVAINDIILIEKSFEEMNKQRPEHELPLEKRSFMAGWIMATNKKAIKKHLEVKQ